MANPITWQNVAQDPSAVYVAGNLLKGAGDSFASGIDQLKGVYNQYQTDRSSENTAAYEAEIAKYTTPEALKAAKDSGVLANLGKQFGLQMNQDVLKNGVRNAQTSLMGDVTAANDYTDMGETRAIQTPAQALTVKLKKDAVNQKILEQAARNANTTAGLTQQGLQNGLTAYNDPQAVKNRATALQLVGSTTEGGINTQAEAARLVEANPGLTAGVAELTRRRDLPVGHPDKMTEFQANQGVNTLIQKLGKTYNLNPTQVIDMQENAAKTMNGVGISDVRRGEINSSLANVETIKKRALDQATYSAELNLSDVVQQGIVSKYVKENFSTGGMGNASQERVLQRLTKELGTSIVINGKPQVVTPAVIIQALESGLMGKNPFGNNEMEMNKVEGALKEVMSRSSYQKQYQLHDALNSNNIEQIKKALGI
jgi:hypothetical protein